MKTARLLWIVLCLMPVSMSALAQDAIQPYVEYRKRIETAQNISPLNVGLFGEQISLYNGSTTFSVTDIDLPGNNALPVQLVRKFAIELQPQNNYGTYDSLLRGMGNWDVDVPYMAATYDAPAGNALRCNGAYIPGLSVSVGFRRGEVWQGIAINIPGRGGTSALGMQTTTPHPSGTATYKLTTSQRDAFDCIPMQAGFTGEGFRMTTAQGVRYYFDVGASRTAARLLKYMKSDSPLPNPFFLDRNRLYLLASKIEDRFGNTVQFQYNANGHPTRIWSNDGREIVLTYTGARLSTATSHGRTWQYQYTNIGSGLYARLSAVVLPDTSRWQYTYTDDLMPPPDPNPLPPMPWCAGMAPALDSTLTMTATHPSGAVGTFSFTNTRHDRSGVHATECMQTGDPSYPNYDLLVPYYYDVMSIDSKTISGAGLSTPLTWSYAYPPHAQTLWGVHTTPLPYPCTTCTAEKTVTVTNPDSTKLRYHFGMRYHDNDGRLLKVETLNATDAVVRTETSTYMTEAAAAAQPFLGDYGSNLGAIADPASTRIRPVVNRTIAQDGVNFVWQANTFDTLARPKNVTRSSTVSGNPIRTEETTYHDNLAKWVLGQVSKVLCKTPTTPSGCTASGVEMFERTYDATYAQPLVTERFGKVEQTLAWDTSSSLAGGQRGTLETSKDGNGNTTSYTSWKRGIPQAVTFPATVDQPIAVAQTAAIDDSGWITSVNDENNNKTCYDYDAMGRLAGITWPSEAAANTCNTSTWAKTTLSFAPVTAVEYGIPAGHWKQTVSTGNSRQMTYYDILWRPLVAERYDNANATGTRSVIVKRYDAAGRLAFQSYPMASLGSYAGTTLQGNKTTYDALGRAAEVQQDSELGVLTTTTAYQSGLKIKVTNPRGNAATTSFMAYDQPTTDWPVAIVHPGGAYTDIARDPYGKPTSITRRNSGGTLTETRNYVYNANQELCRQTEPETGATLVGYDGAGNLAWSAAGLATGTACNAGGTTPAILARKVSRGYDARNRLKTLTFPDSDGNQVWTYTPDSLPTSIVTTMLSDTHIITNQYAYNRRRLPTIETQKLTGWSTYAVTHQYNANGHLASLVYPAAYLGSVVDYAPNALGQPTKAGTFASAVTYYPNGAIQSFTYGNGLKHTLTQNLRGLPDTSCDFASSCSASAVLNDGYDYDANGNVAAISDGQTGNAGNRDMTYDALDRLTQTVAPGMFGTATYTYDVLDNLTRTKVTDGNQIRDHYYCYDTSWRLISVKASSCTGTTVMSLGYDVQGNLANRNGVAYTFDHGNRLRQVAGRETQYLYDGHGRRVTSNRLVNGSSVRRSIYGMDGKLLFVQDQGEAKRKEYIYLGGSLIAERSLPNTGAATPVSIRYQHTDALGSPVAVSNESKAVVERTAYEPFGWAADRALRSGPGYTGHHEDAATGLIYMEQRYYDPGIGRFLSVDPVTANSDNGSNFNRYWYANNNPYKYIDPDGRCTGTRLQIVCEALMPSTMALGERGTPGSTKDNFAGAAKQLYNQAVGVGAAAAMMSGNFFSAQAISEHRLPIADNELLGAAGAEVGTGVIFAIAAPFMGASRGAATGLRMTDTVASHGTDIVSKGPFKGELARPFLNSTMVAREIMASGKGVPDPGGVAGALRWDVPGTFRNTQGTWELVVKDDLIMHFNFVGR